MSDYVARASAVAAAAAESASAAASAAAVSVSEAASAASAAASTASVQASEAAAAAYDQAGHAAEIAKAEALERVLVPMMERKLIEVRDGIKKGQTSDPYMPGAVKSAIEYGVDGVWDDLMDEVTQGLRDSLLSEAEDPEIAYPKPTLCFLHPYWLRSFVLYHFLPYNKSGWEKLYDPWFLLFNILLLVPVFGFRAIVFLVILLFLCLPAPPDEFQLFQFIIRFKGTLFFTAGLVSAMLGGFLYFGCIYNESCNVDGPGATEPGWVIVGDQLINMLLAYAAFWILPFSKKYGKRLTYLECRALKAKQDQEAADRAEAAAAGRAYVPAKEEEDDGLTEEDRKFMKPYCFGACGPLVDSRKAGNLRYLLYWDLFVAIPLTVAWFCLSMAYTGGLTNDSVVNAAGDDVEGQESVRMFRFRACLYWTRVVYAILSFPYVLFAAPGISKIFSHTIPTGFDEWGRCVPLKAKVWDDDGNEVVSSKYGKDSADAKV